MKTHVTEFQKEHWFFITSTIHNYNKLFHNKEYTKIVLNSLNYFVKSDKLYIGAFVIMPNHIHLIIKTKNDNDSNTNEEGFRIERKIGAGSFQEIGTTEALNYADASLEPQTSYTYRVCAYNVKGNSGYSSEVGKTTSALTVFQESGGLLIVEAEAYETKVDRSGHAWEPGSDIDASGGGFLACNPNSDIKP